MNDLTPMPFGKFKGTTLGNVPARYLLWYLDSGKAFGEFLKYLQNNEQVLRKELKETEQLRKNLKNG